MSEQKSTLSPKALIQAAELLTSELAAFEHAAGRASRQELTSFKAIERAKEAIQDSLTARERFGAALVKLVEAVTDARNRQEASAQLLQDRATEIEQRFNLYREIHERFAVLGNEANGINALVVSASSARGTSPEADATARTQLQEAVARLVAVRDQAATLFKDAKDASFQDLANQADSLRQQVGSAATKLERVVDSIPQVNVTIG